MAEDAAPEAGRISIIPGRCIGAGNCVEIAERYFDQDDDDAQVVLLQDVAPAEDHVIIHRAINVCPVAAIAMTLGESR